MVGLIRVKHTHMLLLGILGGISLPLMLLVALVAISTSCHSPHRSIPRSSAISRVISHTHTIHHSITAHFKEVPTSLVIAFLPVFRLVCTSSTSDAIEGLHVG